jgi:hypothetical protein
MDIEETRIVAFDPTNGQLPIWPLTVRRGVLGGFGVHDPQLHDAQHVDLQLLPP